MSHFSFSKKPALFATPAGLPGPGPYYTCLVPMSGVESFPFDYALYYSPDHDPGAGGIWLSLCNGDPSDSANWVSYDEALAAGHFDHLLEKPAQNPIFLDCVQGDGHTETPHVNIIAGTAYMTYHKDGLEGTQRTLLAIAPDGVNFARINGDADSVILRDAPEDVGNGHTGYFRWGVNPFPGIEEAYVGYSLHGGGDDYHSAIWASDDAVVWQCLDILTPIEGFAVDRDDLILIWHELDPASVRPLGNGEFAALCGVGNRASGSSTRITELYEIFLAADGRTLTRESRKILGVGSEESPDAEELASPSSLLIDGIIHLVYVGAAAQGSENTVLGATGRFDASAKPSLLLDESQRRRHIYCG